jgi:signal-transduction protein with cAMP-binding, CBS, and nucleotidyltransferase domain
MLCSTHRSAKLRSHERAVAATDAQPAVAPGTVMKSVADVLAHKGEAVYWIDPLESVFEALKMMHQHDVGALLVMIDGYLVGIVSERDYARKVILDHKASKHTRVSEIMTRDVVQVTRADTVECCLSLMKRHHIRHLPVLEEAQVLGMVSLRDLFLEAIEERVDGSREHP